MGMLMSGIELRARAAMRRAGFGLLGLVFLIIGLGFLTAAGWIVLAEMRSTLFAALVIGGIYSGLGLIFFALASRRNVRVPVEPQMARTYAMLALVEAFMTGISAGMSKKKGSDD